MRNEAEFCTAIVKSLDWGHKISDAGQITHGVLPHDIYGIYNGKPIYIEAKWLKEPQSFNWNRLEDHQLESLMEIKRLCPQSICLVMIGVDFGRNDKRTYVFQDLNEVLFRKKNKKNVLKKEFLKLDYYPIKRGTILNTLVHID